jgi:hypothetical protein
MCRCLIVLVKKRGEGERETHMIFRVLFFIIVLLNFAVFRGMQSSLWDLH